MNRTSSATRNLQKETGSESAADFLPLNLSLKSLRESAANCQGCPLYVRATQTVFGEGPSHAPLMLIGEALAIKKICRVFRLSVPRVNSWRKF